MKARPGGKAAKSPLTWLSVVLVAYLVAPLAVFLARSAGHPAAGFSVPGLWSALATSAEAATISASLVAFFGIPLAYWLARSHSRLAAIAGTAVQLPLALPPLMSGVVLLYVFGNNTFLGRLSGGRLTESVTGIVLAQSFVASPFLVIAARSAFERVPLQLEDVGATAGWGRLGRFWHIALPLAAPGIRAGLLLAWLRAFGEYGATVMMSYYPFSLPVFTYVQFSAVGLPATQAPAVLSLALAGVVAALSRLRPVAVLAAVRKAAARRTEVGPAGLGPAGLGKGRISKRTGPGVPQAGVPVAFDLSTSAGTFRLRLSYAATSPRLAIVGASGAGKSMTLRCLAGLLPGDVRFAGQPVGNLAAEDRHVGYVPQGDSLLPHLRVWDNATLGPHARADLAGYWLEALGLEGLADRLPAELSGGQRQRVALARALSCRPRALLLDEPFTGLDAPQRASLVRELRRLQLAAGLSTVLVTHDVAEAALLADEIVVISAGTMAQSGPLADVLKRPATSEVAGVLGVRNLRPGRAASPTSLWAGTGEVPVEVLGEPHGLAPGTTLTWSVAPRHITVLAGPSAGAYQATVTDVADMGDYSLVRVRFGTGSGREAGAVIGAGSVTRAGAVTEAHVELEAETPSGAWSPGAGCWVSIPPETVLVWPS